MKRVIATLLVMLLVMLAGCSQTAYDESDVRYQEVKSQPMLYYTAEELVNAADCVFEGRVIDISFVVEPSSLNQYHICAVYTVWVADQYKGDVGVIEHIVTPCGFRDHMIEEQVRALRDAGDEDPVTILIDDNVPILEIGSTYIFLADEYIQEGSYEGYRSVASLMQFAVNDDPDLTWIAGAITREDIYEYLGVNPLLRSLARIGIGAVVFVSVGAVVFFVIRANKKKNEEFEISENE